MTPPDDDPVIDEIRAIRMRISAEHGHDTRRLVEHYMKLQERHRDRLLPPPPDEPADRQAA